MEWLEKQAAGAIPAVMDTASDVYAGGQRAWDGAQDLGRAGLAAGQIAYDNLGYGVRAAEQAAARPASWAIDGTARAAEAARDAFGWIAD